MDKKNRIQGMVRSIDQYRNGSPKAVADGSYAQVLFALEDSRHDIMVLWDFAVTAARKIEALETALTDVLDAKALSGIRDLVAGWNGEHLPENERYGRHHDNLGVTLPTNCGAIYELDEAMLRARVLLGGVKSAG